MSSLIPPREVHNPSWLPAGSSVMIAHGDTAPTPMCLVRLLIRRSDGHIFTLPRTDVGKLDLPTLASAAGDDDGTAAIRELQRNVTGGSSARFYGSVRNHVTSGTANYEWPTPYAHFGVWTTDEMPVIDGTWLDPQDSESPLRERHWFALLGAEPGDNAS